MGCGGWYCGYHGWGYHSHYHGHTSINVNRSTRVSISNNTNYGSRTRVSNNINRASAQGRSLPARTNLYNQPESRARNGDRATVERQAQQARATRGTPNNVLADRNGNVVRQTPQGVQERVGNKWENVDRGAAQARAQDAKAKVLTAAPAQARPSNVDRSQVQRDYQNRRRGASREASRPKPTTRPTSRPAARPSGGGARRR